MPRQTLLLIVVLGIVTALLVYIASASKTATPTVQTIVPTQIPVEQTVLMLTPNPLTVSSTSVATSTVNVAIDTGTNAVTAVQFEIAYDPAKITSVKVTASSFFDSPQELINDVNQTSGRISYAVGGPLQAKGKKGKGTIATISFKAVGKTGDTTQLTFMPKSLASAEGIKKSVLKASEGTTIVFGTPATQSTSLKTQQIQITPVSSPTK